MEDLLKKLDSTVSQMEEDLEILRRGGLSNFTKTSVFKKVEDGILENIHNANKHQLRLMNSGNYKFQYYTEYNNRETLRKEIKRRLRIKQIGQILV
jgi:hypothetical protein